MEQPTTSLSDTPLSLEEQPSFIRRPAVRKIIYVCLAVAFLLMVVWPMIVHLQDPDFQKHIEQHRVMAGMTKDQVLKSWGGPQTINTSFTADGLRREEWIFEDWISTSDVKHRYLYFEEGVLIGGWFEGSEERNPVNAPVDSPHPKMGR
ncbi:MAG: hypothetical protein U0412_04575 [Nitrospira sp.]